MEAKDKGEEEEPEEPEEPEATEAVRHNNVVARAHTIKGGRVLAFTLDRDKAISFLALYSLSLYLSICHTLTLLQICLSCLALTPTINNQDCLSFPPPRAKTKERAQEGACFHCRPLPSAALRYQYNVCRPGNNVKPGQHRPLRPSVSLSVSVSQFRIRPHPRSSLRRLVRHPLHVESLYYIRIIRIPNKRIPNGSRAFPMRDGKGKGELGRRRRSSRGKEEDAQGAKTEETEETEETE